MQLCIVCASERYHLVQLCIVRASKLSFSELCIVRASELYRLVQLCTVRVSELCHLVVVYCACE